MYKLNSEGRTAKFYEWMWNADVKKYKTMCPYFWRYVGSILILPLILLAKTIYFFTPRKKKVIANIDYLGKLPKVQKAGKKLDLFFTPNKHWDRLFSIAKWTFIIVSGAMGAVVLIAAIIGFIFYPVKALSIVGGITLFIGFILLIFHLADKEIVRDKVSAPFVFIGNIVSSTYHNYCPRVEW